MFLPVVPSSLCYCVLFYTFCKLANPGFKSGSRGMPCDRPWNFTWNTTLIYFYFGAFRWGAVSHFVSYFVTLCSLHRLWYGDYSCGALPKVFLSFWANTRNDAEDKRAFEPSIPVAWIMRANELYRHVVAEEEMAHHGWDSTFSNYALRCITCRYVHCLVCKTIINAHRHVGE